MQDRISGGVRPAVAQDEPVGLHRRRRGAGVHHRIGDREHVFVVDRDHPLEDEARAIVPGHRHRLRRAQRLAIGGPERIKAGSLCPGWTYNPVSAQ